MFDFLIPIAFDAGKALFDVLANADRPDPEEVYKQRVNEAIGFVKDYFGSLRSKEVNRSRTESALAREMGAREKASQGYSGSVNFASARESDVADRLQQMLESLGSSELGAVANIKTQGINRPITAQPNTFDYLGALAGAGGKISGQKALMDYQSEMDTKSTDDWMKMLKKSTASTSMGQDPMNQSIEQFGKLGEGSFKSPATGSSVGSFAEPGTGNDLLDTKNWDKKRYSF